MIFQGDESEPIEESQPSMRDPENDDSDEDEESDSES